MVLVVVSESLNSFNNRKESETSPILLCLKWPVSLHDEIPYYTR